MIDYNILETIENHRSVRYFKPEPLPTEDVDTMMRLAQRASSGGMAQVYSVIRITDPALRERISRRIGQPVVRRAAEYFIFCMDIHRMRRLLAHRGAKLGMGPLIALIYGIIDCCLSSSSMALAAEAMGYGICYVGAVQRALEDLVVELELPEGVLPLLSLCVGVPDEDAPLRPRLPTDIVFHENVYREPTEADLERCYEAMASATFFGGWFEYLDNFFTAGKEFAGRDGLWTTALARQGLSLDEEAKP
ncbi:MAG: nitroreductase family protein [Anaerolineales bacterium]